MIRITRNKGNERFRAALDFCVRWLCLIHARIAFGFLYLFRSLGRLLARIPWCFRASLAALGAVLILLTACLYGETVLLMSGFTKVTAMEKTSDDEEAAPERINPEDEFSETKLADSGGTEESFSLGQIGALKRANLPGIHTNHAEVWKPEKIQKEYRAAFELTGFNDANLFLTVEQIDALYCANAFRTLNMFRVVGWVILGVLALGIVLASVGYWVKVLLKPGYYLLASGGVAFGVYWLILIVPMFGLPDQLLQMNRKDFDSVMRNMMWFAYLWLWVPALFYSFFAWFPLFLSRAKNAFGVHVKTLEFGDVWEKNLKCEGDNPGLYRGGYWAFSYHFVILLLIPLLLKGCYWNDSYEIPKGDGGGPVEQFVKVVKPKPKKAKKRYVFNENSSISFAVPEMDDSISQELEEETEKVYETTVLNAMGGGGKGTRPGWPNGMENARIRFIRLEYAGGDWDQDMGKGADYNMLQWLADNVGFKIADDTEAIKIKQLSRWKKGKAPPFVYITGSRGISVNSAEVKQIRTYLLNGGMLFADNGGGYFDRSFRNLMRQVLPELQMVDIANDDPIYREPFAFPNGAPPLFHHSGSRALGVRYNGRWLVFYHQGDINDAWKAGGSGVSRQVQERAFKMGANVIAYSFTQYLAMISGSAFR